MAKVFVSHSWDDKPLVRDLESRLREAGAEVWVDHAKVRGGDNLPKRISDALDWCDTLLLLWSKAASQSKWVEKEWSCAISLERTVIPCRVDGTGLPALLANLLYVDLRDREPGVKALMTALKLSLPTNKAATATASGAQPPAVQVRAGRVPEEHLRALLPKGDSAHKLVFCLGAIERNERDDLYALLADISSRRSRQNGLYTIFAVLSADPFLTRALSKVDQKLTTYLPRVPSLVLPQGPLLIDFSEGPPGRPIPDPYPFPRDEAIVFLGDHSLNSAILDYFAPAESLSRDLSFDLPGFLPFRNAWGVVDPNAFPPLHWSALGRERLTNEVNWLGRRVTFIPATLRDYIRAVKAYAATQS
jgi:hypothetical protein